MLSLVMLENVLASQGLVNFGRIGAIEAIGSLRPTVCCTVVKEYLSELCGGARDYDSVLVTFTCA